VTFREQAFWVFMQLYKGHVTASDYINFRVIHDETPYHDPETGKLISKNKSLANFNVSAQALRAEFLKPGGLYDKLLIYNSSITEPANIYYGINTRTHKNKNNKAHIKGFLAFYLDLDVTPDYTLEDRMAQISFWKICGFGPTFTVNSGHGLQPYWCLKEMVDQETGEKILKRMVHLAGTEVKGATWDITRIFRLPGFRNVKYWYHADTPDCVILDPDLATLEETYKDQTLLKRYHAAHLANFPLSRKADILEFTKSANLMEGDYGTNLQALVIAKIEQDKAAEAQHGASLIKTHEEQVKQTLEVKLQTIFTPHRKLVPMELEDIAWSRGTKVWIKIYCVKGIDKLTELDLDKIRKKCNTNDISASELDAKVIYQLIRLGYTEDAVIAFFNRPDLRLYRPDKMASNPNYLSMTYAKMLEAVQNAMDGKTADGQGATDGIGAVVFRDNSTYIGTPQGPRRIISGVPEINQIFENLDADADTCREYYNITFQTLGSNGAQAVTRMIPRADFDSVAKFKTHCQGNVFCITDKNSDLASLGLHMRSRTDDKIILPFRTNMAYNAKTNSFVFPRITVFADKIIKTTTFEMVKDLQNKFPWHDGFIDEVPTQEEGQEILRQQWLNICNLHLPRMVCSLIGLIAASGMRAVFHGHKLTTEPDLPTVNIRGRALSGKSKSAKILFKLTGATDLKQTVVSLESSNFSLNRMPELMQFTPQFIDEFKEGEDNQKMIANIRALVRRAYTGETIFKGRQDLGLSGSAVHGKMCIIGESNLERIGNLSEFGRIFAVVTDDYVPSDHMDSFERVESAPLHKLGPLFYQWLLHQDPQEAYDDFKALRKNVTTNLSAHFANEKIRVGNNIAALMWGCRLYSNFVKSLCPELPTLEQVHNMNETFVEYTANMAEETGTVVSYKGKEGQVIMARDEVLNFLSRLSEMIQNKAPEISKILDSGGFIFRIKEDSNTLELNLAAANVAYREHMLRQKYVPIELSVLHARIQGAVTRKEDWVIMKSRVAKFKGESRRVLVLKLSALREMHIWHDAPLTQKPKIPPSVQKYLTSFEDAED